MNLVIVAGHGVDRCRKEAVFRPEDPSRERVFVVIRQDRNGFLKQDRSAIQPGINKMHGSAGPPNAGLQRLSLGMHPGKGGQQGGMDIQNGPSEVLDESRPEHAHVAGKADQIDGVGLYRRQDRLFMGGPVDATTGNAEGLDPRLGCQGEGAASGYVRYDQRDSIGRKIVLGCDERAEIASPSACEDRYAFHTNDTPSPSTSSPMR